MKKNSFLYNPKTYTLSSMIIGYLLIGDLTANEQNALGNWLENVGQILEGNAAFQQLIEERFKGNTYNINSKKYKKTGNPQMDNLPLLDILSNDQATIEELKRIIKNLEKRLDELSQNKKA